MVPGLVAGVCACADTVPAVVAVAAMFAFMNQANAAMDAGEDPGPSALSAWEKAEAVLGVTTPKEGKWFRGYAPTITTTPAEIPPLEGDARMEWAVAWAKERARHKSARNYAEADRIRALLQSHGFQVRDSRDGSIEVVRTAGSRTNT